jgi:hypothetical protein
MRNVRTALLVALVFGSLCSAVVAAPENEPSFAAIDAAVEAGKLSARDALEEKLRIAFAAQLGDVDSGPGLPAAPIKCATDLLWQAGQERESLTADAQALLSRLESLPSVSALIYDTPEGHFRVLYETAGTDAVPPDDGNMNGIPDYVEWTGEAMEQSWALLSDGYGFPSPALGINTRYEVELKDLGAVYGYTQAGSRPGGTFIVINSDFEGFYQLYPNLINEDPDGRIRGAIRVTSAHEFKHASQYAESGWTEFPQGWNELDATWTEDIVFTQVNDYYNYLLANGSPFRSPSTSLNAASYEDSTWEHFMSQRFGVELVRAYGDRRALKKATERPAVSYYEAFVAQEINWAEGWGEYTVWNYLSGTRARVGWGFEEAARYPTATVQAYPSLPQVQGSGNLPALSQAFHQYNNLGRVTKAPVVATFSSPLPMAWTVRLVLQNQTETVVLPMTIEDGQGTLESGGHRMADYDRVALLVGCGHVDPSQSTTTLYAYSFSLAEGVPVAPHPELSDTSFEMDGTTLRVGVQHDRDLSLRSLELVYRIEDRSWNRRAFELFEFGPPDRYVAEVGGAPRGARIEYYIEAVDELGLRRLEPEAGAQDPFVVHAGAFRDEFSTASSGWTVDTTDHGGDMPERGWILGTARELEASRLAGLGAPADDSSRGEDGRFYFLQGVGSISSSSVLTSPQLSDLRDARALRIRYARWFDGRGGARLVAEISADGGRSWSLLEGLGGAAARWSVVDVDPLVALAGQRVDELRLRFRVEGLSEDAEFLAAIDDVEIIAYGTDPGVVPMGVGSRVLLGAPFPNPIRGTGRTAMVRFSIPRAGPVSLKLYDLRGRLLRTILQDESRPAGDQLFVFGDALRAEGLAAGVYLLRLWAGEERATRRLVILR